MGDNDDRLDRNWRSNTDNTDRLRDQISDLKTTVEVIKSKFEGLNDSVVKGFATVDSTVREFKSMYATKTDLDEVKEKVKDMQKVLVRIAWIVGTPVLLGIAAAGIHFASFAR